MSSNAAILDELRVDSKNCVESQKLSNFLDPGSTKAAPPKGNKDPKKSPFGQLLDAVRDECTKNGIWSEDLQRDLPKKWEKHGNMILLPENSFSNRTWRLLGRKLWPIVAKSLQCERLGRKRRIEDDDYRTPHVELLFGPDGWVEHVDNSIKYQYDVTKCMFSIGNITEKLRIAGFDCRGETIVDMFAGIGYFTLPYLIHAKAAFVYACEWNPDAVEALKRNLIVNKVENLCTILEGDCRKCCPIGVADRVNMGLLPTASPYWLTSCRALKSEGGYLHIHENVTVSKLKKSTSCDVGRSEVNFLANNNDSPVSRVPDKKSPGFEKHLSFDSSTLPTCVEKNGESDHVDPDETIDSTNRPPRRRLSQTIEEEMAFLDAMIYEPLVDENFKEKWTQVDESYRKFAERAAGKVFKYLNNMHNKKFLVKICYIGKIKSYAPRIDHVVLDLLCSPEMP